MGIRSMIEWAIRGRQQTCEACQASFTCGPLKSCWCGKECLARQTLADLKQKYHHCLCPDCLRAADEAVRARTEKTQPEKAPAAP